VRKAERVCSSVFSWRAFFFFSGFGGGSVMEVLLVSKMEKKTNGKCVA